MHAWAVIPSNMYNPQTIQVNIKNNKVKHVHYLYVVIIPLFRFKKIHQKIINRFKFILITYSEQKKKLQSKTPM